MLQTVYILLSTASVGVLDSLYVEKAKSEEDYLSAEQTKQTGRQSADGKSIKGQPA